LEQNELICGLYGRIVRNILFSRDVSVTLSAALITAGRIYVYIRLSRSIQ